LSQEVFTGQPEFRIAKFIFQKLEEERVKRIEFYMLQCVLIHEAWESSNRIYFEEEKPQCFHGIYCYFSQSEKKNGN